MSHFLAQWRVLAQIAFRNLLASRINLVIGGIILVGTAVVVIGGAMLDSIDAAMSRSIIGSVAGHIQIYREDSKDPLALFGSMGGEPDLRVIDDFSRVKAELEQVPNVERVVPMGISGAIVTSGNTIDLTLARLRSLETEKAREGAPFQHEQERVSVREHVRRMVDVVRADVARMRELATEAALDPRDLASIEKASEESFWATWDEAPLDRLEFLENRIAPQVADGDLLFLRYVGTDLESFAESFNRLEIVDGQAVPKGQRGIILSKYFYEEYVKLKTARRLDKIKEAMETRGAKIATDQELQRFVKENQTQTREFLLQFDALKSQTAVAALQKSLGSTKTDLTQLLREFFNTTDENFASRYQVFYSELAPLLELYRIRVGDTMTIKAFTRTGYVQSVNVKVYGTFQFSGLEKNALAGGLNLMDLVSFRELYGHLTAEKREEIAALKTQANVAEVTREDAEDALFGEGREIVAEATPGLIEEPAEDEGVVEQFKRQERIDRVYSKEEIEKGVALNSAIILKNPEKLQQTLAEINRVSKEKGLKLKAVSWQEASGLIGQFVQLAKIVLYFAVFIIFIVALVIINNAVMMATLQRIREIGTMRAIGAQRAFVLSMVLAETLVLGLVFGGGGMLLGSGIIGMLNRSGIPAGNDALYFFFSGPRLYPVLTPANLVAALVIVVLVSAVSTMYPAFLSTRVSPVRAMSTDE